MQNLEKGAIVELYSLSNLFFLNSNKPTCYSSSKSQYESYQLFLGCLLQLPECYLGISATTPAFMTYWYWYNYGEIAFGERLNPPIKMFIVDI